MELESTAKVLKAMEKFPLETFDFARDERKAMSACSFALIGSSKSGKTTFLKYLLKHHFKEDIKVLMTQSPQADIYTTIKKDCVFCPAYLPDIIKTCYMINKHTKNHYPFCCIIDDVIGAKNDQQMSKLLCLYRNSRCSAIVCGQDYTLLNANGRANVNNILLFSANTDNRCEDNIKLFLRSYFPRNLSIEEKIDLHRRCTADHCFFWVDALNNTIKRCRLNPSQISD